MPASALALAVGIGFVAGLRTFTAPAAVSWAAHLGWLDLGHTKLAFMGSTAAVVIFSLLAVAEYVGDVLPFTPNRTKPGPLFARWVSGALSGACLNAAAEGPMVVGAGWGMLGALIGTYVGYLARTRTVRALKVKDIFVAIPEDIIAIALALFIVSR